MNPLLLALSKVCAASDELASVAADNAAHATAGIERAADAFTKVKAIERDIAAGSYAGFARDDLENLLRTSIEQTKHWILMAGSAYEGWAQASVIGGSLALRLKDAELRAAVAPASAPARPVLVVSNDPLPPAAG